MRVVCPIAENEVNANNANIVRENGSKMVEKCWVFESKGLLLNEADRKLKGKG